MDEASDKPLHGLSVLNSMSLRDFHPGSTTTIQKASDNNLIQTALCYLKMVMKMVMPH